MTSSHTYTVQYDSARLNAIRDENHACRQQSLAVGCVRLSNEPAQCEARFGKIFPRLLSKGRMLHETTRRTQRPLFFFRTTMHNGRSLKVSRARLIKRGARVLAPLFLCLVPGCPLGFDRGREIL